MNAIIVCASNLPSWWEEICLPRIAAYADICDAHLRVVVPKEWRGVVSRGEAIAPEVKHHDRSLVLDADVVISRSAPNIFKTYDRTGDVRMAFDARPGDEICWNRVDDIVAVQAMMGGLMGRWTHGYHNAGVVLCDQMHDLMWRHWAEFIPEMWPDQANVNYFARKYYSIEPLPREWNSFGMSNGFLNNEPEAIPAMANSFIAHAAGMRDRNLALRELDRLMP